MAVTYAEIDELSDRAAQLNSRTMEIRAQIERARSQAVAENRALLEQMRKDTTIAIEQRERAVEEKYSDILSRNITEQEQRLQNELKRVQSEYDEVCAQINKENAVRHKEAEQLLIKQQAFERAFWERREFLKTYAVNTYEQATDEYIRFSESIPAEWFLKGHLALYKSKLSEADKLIENELYESAVAVCENMKLNIRIDEINIMDNFTTWQRYYMILADLLSTARELIFEKATHIPSDMRFVNIAFDIKDGIISTDQLNTWIKDYAEFKTEYGRYYDLLNCFYCDGKLIAAEKLREFMIAKPELSLAVSMDELYRNIGRMHTLIKHISCCINSMHSAVHAFEERLELIYKSSFDNGGRGLNDVLNEAGYEIVWMTGADDGKLDSTVTLGFADNHNVMNFELMITPIQRWYDGRWINLVDWYYPSQASQERIKELVHIIAEVFVSRGIHVSAGRMIPDQETEIRIRESRRNRMLLINGRTN